MAEPIALKYRAFISYSHADTGWAKWLHGALESFTIDKDLVGRESRTGTIPKTLRPIFRDRDDFTAGHDLTEQTLAALDASAALIVICSSSSAKSPYVKEEIRLFKLRHPDRPVIPLIVAGKPGDPDLECFSAALKFKLDADGQVTKTPIEVLAADAREEGDGKSLALAKVIAGLLGLSSDDVFRRAERERRAAARRRRRVQAIVGGLGLLLAAAGVAWLNQDYLREQYYWHLTMQPRLLTQEHVYRLKPGGEFTECVRGCPHMVVVPPGKFPMGSTKSEGTDFSQPQHEVAIAQPFAVGKFELTFGEWDHCYATGGCPWISDGNLGRGERPVMAVTWDEAKQYVAWLSKLTDKPYRLLTEAEWEYAARAGTTTVYSFGDDESALGDYAWYLANSANGPRPVGTKKPNAFGLCDVHGNVGELVEDEWHGDYVGAPSNESAWLGNALKAHVVRGGSYIVGPTSVRSASRTLLAAQSRFQFFGFRIARTLSRQD